MFLPETLSNLRGGSTKARTASGEAGQSIVLIAFLLVALLGIAALVFDGGTAYAKRRQMQNAADSAALAGARQLARVASDSTINSAIRDYAITRNGADTYTATYYPGGQALGTGSVPTGATGVTVNTRGSFQTFFLSVLGGNGGAVGAASTSAYGNIGGISTVNGGVYPIARSCNQSSLSLCGFQIGQSYDIWQGGGSGNLGWLTWNGDGSASALEAALLPPGTASQYRDPVSGSTQLQVGGWVSGSSGVSGTAGVKNQLDYWVSQGRVGNPMLMIVYDQSTGSGSSVRYRVAGFAAFNLTSYDLTGKHITGTFANYVAPGLFCTACQTTGLTAVHIIPPP